MLQDLEITRPLCSRFVGKTVQTVVAGLIEDEVLFTFTDGTMAKLITRRDYGSQWVIADHPFSLADIFAYDYQALLESGVATQADIEEYWRRIEENNRRRQDQHDLALYQKLKAKFEPPTTEAEHES